MGHDHDHCHNHEPQHDSVMAFSEKAAKLLDHWIRHNDEHAQSYRQWATEFQRHQLVAAAALLETAAELIQQINHTLQQAAQQITPEGQ